MTAPTLPTTLYRGGFVYSPVDPFATAMVVEGEHVAWVGSDQAAAAHADTVDTVVELDGALLTPAFVDAHVHLSATGQAMAGVDLSGCASLAEALARVEAAARRRQGRPLFAHSFEESRWPEQRPPTRSELDRASYGGVVYLTRIDAHSGVASSALSAAADARSYDGWDDSGRIRGDAHHAVRDTFAAGVTAGERRGHIAAALAGAAAAGIALVHEHGAPHLSSPEDMADALAAGERGGGPQVVGYWGELVESAEQARALADRLGARGLAGDLCADGSLGSRTASLREPYADAPGSTGSAYLSVEQVRDHVVACSEAGLQAGFHVIGDAAAETVVDGFRRAAGVVGVEALRRCGHRLEHLEMVDDALLDTVVGLGVSGSVQPAFDAAWGGTDGMYAARLGTERAALMNPFATMAAKGLPFALGSDSPVTPFAPWAAVAACVHHHSPEQRISARSAFLAHTRAGWRLAGVDDRGYLGLGQPATFAVWAVGDLVVQAPDDRVQTCSTDPRSGIPGLPDLSPGVPLPTTLRTVVRGHVVYEREGALV